MVDIGKERGEREIDGDIRKEIVGEREREGKREIYRGRERRREGDHR